MSEVDWDKVKENMNTELKFIIVEDVIREKVVNGTIRALKEMYLTLPEPRKVSMESILPRNLWAMLAAQAYLDPNTKRKIYESMEQRLDLVKDLIYVGVKQKLVVRKVYADNPIFSSEKRNALFKTMKEQFDVMKNNSKRIYESVHPPPKFGGSISTKKRRKSRRKTQKKKRKTQKKKSKTRRNKKRTKRKLKSKRK
jgi:hypothetical protein